MNALCYALKRINPKVWHGTQLRQSVITEWLKEKGLRQLELLPLSGDRLEKIGLNLFNYEKSRQIYGSPRIAHQLKRKNIAISRSYVGRLIS